MSAPVKVVWVSCVGEKGGAEVYMLNLFRRLDRDQFIPLVAQLRPGPLNDELAQMGVKTFVLPRHRMREVPAVLRTILELRRIIRREGIGLVHGNGFRAHVYAGIAAWLARVPCAWLVHTVEQPSWFTSLMPRIPVARVVANCERTARYFVARGLPVTLLHPSVDPDHLQRQTSREVLAKHHGIPVSARWICLGARLQRYKGHEFFLRSLAALPPEFGDTHGIIMGGTLFGMEESYPAELKALAASLGIAHRVHFTGFIPDEDLHGLLAAGELLVHPALDEDFGLIVAEAQALGRPVVAFASVGPAAIIDDGATGRLVPIGDQARLTAGIREVLGQPELGAGWGAAARVRARELFSATTAAAQLEEIYRGCLPHPVTLTSRAGNGT